MNKHKNTQIGFIGQGWIGKNYADNFEERGYNVTRYALEEPYLKNKDKIKNCDIVFIAVPTPTTPAGFDDSIVRKAIKLVGNDKTAVIKSTLLPGSTESIQKENPNIFVVHSPEFLVEVTAKHDATNPKRNIVGIPKNDKGYRQKAQIVIDILPSAPYNLVCDSREAELIKYSGNCWLYFKVIYINMLYDLSQKLDCDWEKIKDAMGADPRIGSSHMNPVHKSGRGVGGHCLIKDFAAFSTMYKELINDDLGSEILKSIKNKNINLLKNSGKDLDLLKEVYGKLN